MDLNKKIAVIIVRYWGKQFLNNQFYYLKLDRSLKILEIYDKNNTNV